MRCRLKLLMILSLLPLGVKAQQAADSSVIVELRGGTRFEMVWVAGGDFVMGSNAARGVKVHYDASYPEHLVQVDDFFIGRFEVTQGLWREVMGDNPSKFQGNDSLPVEQITWEEAQQFTVLLSQMTGYRFRLPTEAEWEFAARGGMRSKVLPFAGCTRKTLDDYCWYCVNSDGHTHQVGGREPNELGLYDMNGNVSEWCFDWVGEYSPDPQVNPRGPKRGDSRVLSGGHYNSISSACTVYDRGWYVPSGKCELYGMRLVMEVEKDY